MSRNFTLNELTKDIRDRHVGQNTRRLVEKWSRTGLLRNLTGPKRENMSVLLENQAAEVLREANSLSTGGGGLTSSGDVRGFTNVAFPIVRRVFGGLVANELVSIQPMSLPAGLLFYLDYTYGSDVGGDTHDDVAVYEAGASIYNNPTGKGIRSGSLAVGGQYDLAGSGYSRVHANAAAVTILASGSYQGDGAWTAGAQLHATGTDGVLLQFDPQLSNNIEDNNSGAGIGVYSAWVVSLTTAAFANADLTMVKDFALHGNGATVAPLAAIDATIQQGKGIVNVRRLNQLGTWQNNVFTPTPLIAAGAANAAIMMVVSGTSLTAESSLANVDVSYVVDSAYNQGTGDTLVIPAFESDFAATPSPAIPEIDIKIESIAVTAVTRKLRAKWSPELAQDLNAYHSLDAEVELTQILSEQVALELDREILNDLLTQANGASFYWSRMPGKFLNKETGAEVKRSDTLAAGPAFHGNVREWYETLIETIIDVANTIHRKTLRGSANFIVTSPDVCTILESSVLYTSAYNIDGEGQVSAPFTMGAQKAGALSNRFTVYKDPYFPRNKILVGYKGGSYLETGYVYAPYVPLIITPTIFAPEDFTPRKGVMTRYGKKMVRSDFYGKVTVLDMNVI
jgi:hypothetical protein